MPAGQRQKGVNVMLNIDLSEKDAEELCEILSSYLSELRMEITDTEKKEWRENMKKRQLFIEDLMKRLQPATP
jgi:hypothetical protein